MALSQVVKYIYDLPYKARLELCNILDYNNDWKTLGGSFMSMDCYELFQMEGAVMRRGSPTDELLSRCGARNLTLLELFKYLHCMKHYRAMLILKPYVDPIYHRCIPDSCAENRTIKAQKDENEERCIFSEHKIKTAQPTVKVSTPEASVKEGSSPGNQNNQLTRKVSDPVTPMNILGGTPHISYEELTLATNNWDRLNIIGKGGFGTVYKGFWKNTTIAVKKLEVQRSGKSEETLNQCQREQSMRELKYLNSCRHDNILPLYGISFESGKYCLVYQFMPNGSLEDRLLMRKNTQALIWTERLHIAKGTALGLQFLHSRDPPLIHGDIKSANILLNTHMDPVIGDFGLTQEGPIEKATHITLKRVNGTRPYLPYEFLSGKRLSTKVDVYAFGIVLFELATGMRAYDDSRRSERHLKSLVEKYSEENIYDLVDKNAQPLELTIAYAFFKIGKVSTKMLVKERPEMIQVFNLLCGSASSNAESTNAIGPRPTVTLSSATPVRTMSPNNLPRYKFGSGGKGPEPGVPYLPAPIQILNTPHILQQVGSLAQLQHISPNFVRPQQQQTGSQKTPQDILSPAQQLLQGNFVRIGNPQDITPNSIVKESSVSQQQHIMAIPSPALNMTSGFPLDISTSPATSLNTPVLSNVIRSLSPSSLIKRVIPEASQSQDKESHDCSSGFCNHSSSESTTSVEILDRTPEQPLGIQDRENAEPSLQDHRNSHRKVEDINKLDVSLVTPDRNRGVDIVPAESMPLLQLLNIKR